ncbi:MAG: RnfABCDGE type electron transport complex subunit D [Oscillospiraceae bacterium]|nr:RnfABCDGE type electron transport complex subunit D [Oscillospiraceae bacterium]
MSKLTVSPSPHIKSEMTTANVMTHVIIGLFPMIIAGVLIFGGSALMLMGLSVAMCLLWEKLFCVITKKKDTTDDLSAVVTGILLSFNVPATLPLWMMVIGTFVAIVITKMLFGGLGQNFANPAIVGRIVLTLSFAEAMTTFVEPFYYRSTDVVTQATPLATGKASYKDLLFGNISGCLGEVCAIAILIGGVYLLCMRIITWHIPLAYIGTVGIFSLLAGKDPVYQILSGGLLLGAFFMATDYVTSPTTKIGKLIFGVGCGIITCVIRFYASSAEGVSYAILLMNIITPYIDMATRKKPLGAKEG